MQKNNSTEILADRAVMNAIACLPHYEKTPFLCSTVSYQMDTNFAREIMGIIKIRK